MILTCVACFSGASRPHARRPQQVRADVQARPRPQAADDAAAADRRADTARHPRRGRARAGLRHLALRRRARQAGDPDPAGVLADQLARVVARARAARPAAAAAAAAAALARQVGGALAALRLARRLRLRRARHRRRHALQHRRAHQHRDPARVAHDPRVRADHRRPRVAELALRTLAKPNLQPVRGGSLRVNVQSAGPKSLLTGRLGEKHRVL